MGTKEKENWEHRNKSIFQRTAHTKIEEMLLGITGTLREIFLGIGEHGLPPWKVDDALHLIAQFLLTLI